MKIVIGLLVLGGIVLFLVFQFGASGLSTAEQAKQFREKVSPGMSWEQVADVKEPRKYIEVSRKAMGGERQPINFKRKAMKKMVSNGALADGFIFRYRFDQEHTWNVVFDSAGTVQAVRKPHLTTKGLLHGEAFKN